MRLSGFSGEPGSGPGKRRDSYCNESPGQQGNMLGEGWGRS